MLLYFLLAGHFIGDFAFQSEWMANAKATSWEINAYHALTYTSMVFLAGAIGGTTLPLWALALLFISHSLIDPLKARWKIIKPIWLDQMLHLLVLLSITAILTYGEQ